MSKRSLRTAKTVSERAPSRPLWFYDASAVAKVYLSEPQTPDVRRWMAAGRVVVSRISVVEVASAVHRRAREGFLSSAARDGAIATLALDLQQWDLVELTEAVAVRAIRLLGAHPVRAGDAIQLASALIVRDNDANDFGRFVAYDARLLAAARAEGLPTEEY